MAKRNQKSDKTAQYFEMLRSAVKSTGKYSPADDTMIEHAALILTYIDEAKDQVTQAGMIQVFKTGARQIAPEINNLRGLMSDFSKYCDDLGLSPKARQKLDIQIQKEENPKLKVFFPNKAANE